MKKINLIVLILESETQLQVATRYDLLKRFKVCVGVLNHHREPSLSIETNAGVVMEAQLGELKMCTMCTTLHVSLFRQKATAFYLVV